MARVLFVRGAPCLFAFLRDWGSSGFLFVLGPPCAFLFARSLDFYIFDFLFFVQFVDLFFWFCDMSFFQVLDLSMFLFSLIFDFLSVGFLISDS